ncbi:hypothetical protein COL940_010001 [Colletotrichum noveboracense]|nr:hypothetical protein COL940_010001 [Colletotrichum noveboracense]
MQLIISNIILGFFPALALLTGVDAQAARSMSFIGCSMAENVAQGYIAVGGTRMWTNRCPELTDNLAKRASEDTSLNVKYGGTFRLHNGEVADGCHANTAGQQSLGRQAIGFWG